MSQPGDTDRLLKRVLGPDGPELTCEQCFEHLDRYVELELAHKALDEHGARDEPRNAADDLLPGMRAHLQGCPACAEDHESLLAYVSEQAPRSTT
jgi:hypothetical protein